MTINLTELATQMGVMLLIVAAGYLARRFSWLDPAADGAFSQIIVRMTAPCLVFYGIVGNREKLLSGSLLQVVLAVAGVVTLAGGLAMLLYRGRHLRPDHRSVLRVATMFGNVSFLGIPLCYGLFGQDDNDSIDGGLGNDGLDGGLGNDSLDGGAGNDVLSYASGLMYASLYAAAQDALYWSVGVAMMRGGHGKLDWKRLVNPSLVGILLAVVLVATGVPVPAFLVKTASTVGAATLPLSLLVVGAGFHGVKLDGRTLAGLLPVAGLKLVLVPTLMVLALSLVPMDPMARAVLAMEMAMPSGAATVALARTNGQDWQFAAGAVMLTTLLSAVTVPLTAVILNRIGL